MREKEAQHIALLGLCPWVPVRLGADGGALELPFGLRLNFALAPDGRVTSVLLADLKVWLCLYGVADLNLCRCTTCTS